MSLPFLLEIGTEEIPDWMIRPALEGLEALFRDLLDASRLSCDALRADGTPRRLVLRASGIPERQADSEERVLGPAKSASPKAVEGFARKLGVRPEELALETTQKGEYFTHIRKIPGADTRRALSEALPALVPEIPFPKTMYWTGRDGPRFIRPIRWIVALLGDQVVPFELAGVKSGNVTRGHRQLGAAEVPVSIADYDQRLRENFVLLASDERRRKIEADIAGLGVKLRPDPALLETLVNLTEYPAAICGCFDERFLDLPEEVLVTVMRHHQKYFSVERSEGGLAPQFVAVMNTSSDPEGLVRRGHERVLRARFNDARFFWQADQRKQLADRIPDLAGVTFQAKLGSYLEKTERMVKLAEQLGGGENAVRAAWLSKCDLTTELVKEFTELQGVVGGLYAREQGEPEAVWQAVYDHYKPQSMEDSIPRKFAGRVVSIADKLDTLRGCFRAGLIPTGSRDPFALRRAAQGIVRIAVEGGLRLPVRALLDGDPKLEEFVLDRVRYYFRDLRGFRYDEVNAVVTSGWGDLVDVGERLEAIRAVRPTANFEPLAASFKRIRNILKQAEFTGGVEVSRELLEPGPEAALYEEFERVRSITAGQPYLAALESIASLRPKVDLFFDKVLVNAPDPRIRANRLALLDAFFSGFSKIADFSEIVTQEGSRAG